MSPLPVCLLAVVSLLSVPLRAADAASGGGSGASGSAAVTADHCVTIKDVKFTQTKQISILPWNRVEIEVLARGNPDPKAANKKWVDKVKVTLTLVYKNPTAKSAEEWNYYRSSATILTLEQNQPRSVLFYLPGDIVKRDNLRKEPDHYYIDLEVAGVPQAVFDARGLLVPDQKASVSKDLTKKADLEGCKGFADRGVLATAGILRPQYMLNVAEKESAFSPEYVREDSSSR